MKSLYAQYGGAVAGTTGAGAVEMPTIESMRAAIAGCMRVAEQWEQSFNAYALQHECDLEGDGVMIVPQSFDMSLVPPKYRGRNVRRSPLATGFIFFRSPNGMPPLAPDEDAQTTYF